MKDHCYEKKSFYLLETTQEIAQETELYMPSCYCTHVGLRGLHKNVEPANTLLSTLVLYKFSLNCRRKNLEPYIFPVN
jgi:hypothetical protein